MRDLLKKLKEASEIDDSRSSYCRITTAVDHRSLGFPSTRKSTRKGKIVSLLVICGNIKRSRGHETIPVHRTAIKTVISGRIDVGVNVTRDIRDSRFRSM